MYGLGILHFMCSLLRSIISPLTSIKRKKNPLNDDRPCSSSSSGVVVITNDLYTNSRHSHSATQKPAPKTPHRPAPNPPAFTNRSFAQTPASSRFHQMSEILDLHYNPSAEDHEYSEMPPYANLNHAAQTDPVEVPQYYPMPAYDNLNAAQADPAEERVTGEHQVENDYQELDGPEETIVHVGARQVNFLPSKCKF